MSTAEAERAGSVAVIPVERGQNVAASAVLVKIDNPETLAKNEQALAAGAHGGECRPGAEDLRPHQPVGHQRQCSAGPARSDDRCFARGPTRRGSGPIILRAGRQRLHPRGARDRRGERRESDRRHQSRSIDHRPDGDLRASGFAGLSATWSPTNTSRPACRW
jgi:hypothetical protein